MIAPTLAPGRQVKKARFDAEKVLCFHEDSLTILFS